MDDKNRGVIVNRMGAFVAIPVTFINDERITNAGRCLYMLLSSYTSAKADEAIAFPSYETIMKRLGWNSKHTVADGLKNLIGAGWVERRRRYGSSSVYTLNYAPETVAPVVQKVHHQKCGISTTDSAESAHQLEVHQPEVPKPEVDPATAAARAAGIGSQPSQRIARNKTKLLAAKSRMEELEAAPAIAAHRRICGIQPMTLEQAEMIVSSVNGTAETTWPADLTAWVQGTRKDGKPFRLDAIERQVQWHTDAETRRKTRNAAKAVPTLSAAEYAELTAKMEAPL